ncbi:acetylornithine deacetylase [Silicimonas algicola]|uniref:Acetylornithine deacetylase n=1 Tax=Silicimonas algicola TaxID=1826607 RepID=A0A316GC07_9RHOB|nr:acetylornithine deacetylase [Silicimonas algicola]AZQ66154.1 acetylornithine deacetylase [Silicimonas algicola]PWK58461.1 acetylornithine deacetylase [Silicimonas algicola]
MPDVLSPRAILERLVAFPTVSHGTNLPLIDWVEGYLTAHGLKVHRAPKEGDPTKHALFCSVGPEVAGGIVLSGHTDVVPVEGQDWSTDPWTLIERDGRLYGRGSCDMKGFDALAIHALVRAKDAGLVRPLQIALSYDEEIGCMGAPPLIRAMDEAGLPRAAIAIIGEPSMMKCVTGHKGGTGFDVHVEGHEVHSSIMHRGVNAIMEAAKLIVWANEMNDLNRAKNPSAIASIFEPPWTTLHVGEIRGGTAHNITAGDCHFPIDWRFVPDDDEEVWKEWFRDKVAEVEAGMKAVAPASGIYLNPFFGVPGLRPETDGAAERLVRSITGDNGEHVVSYGTEAGHFQDAGFSAVVCGPGDIAQAHQADEFIEISQLEAGEAFLSRVIDDLCA